MIAFALGLNYVYAWTAPTVAPPNGNVSAPINVGTTDQVKNGGLSVNAFSAFGNAYVQGSLGVGDVTPDGGLKVDVEGNVGASAYCNQNGTGCITAANVANVANVVPRVPDYESGWIPMGPDQTGVVTHNLGTDVFSNFQMVARQSATANDEVVTNSMNSYDSWEYNSGVHAIYGLSFFIDKSSNPLNTLRWMTGLNGVFCSLMLSSSNTIAALNLMNWTPTGATCFQSGEIKVRIWK